MNNTFKCLPPDAVRSLPVSTDPTNVQYRPPSFYASLALLLKMYCFVELIVEIKILDYGKLFFTKYCIKYFML